MENVSAGVSLFLFWCVRLEEEPLRLGSGFVFPSFLLLLSGLCPLLSVSWKSKVKQILSNFLMSPYFLQQTSGRCKTFDVLWGAPHGVGLLLMVHEPL